MLNPATPALMPLPIILDSAANRAANKTTQFPTNSNLTANHLFAIRFGYVQRMKVSTYFSDFR